MAGGLRIGSVELGVRPCVAVPFADRTTRAEVLALALRGLDVAELRIDHFARFDPAHVLAQLDVFARIPVLATIRSAAEGGGWKGTEAERLALFRALLPRADAVDVEIASEIAGEVVGLARAAGKLAIASFHDFEKTPGDAELADVVARGRALGADVVKIATAVAGPCDLRSLARLLVGTDDIGLIAIGMGDRALATRLLFPALGSLLTYAHAGAATAPGQIPLDEMHALLRRLFPSAV
jgi:3-dehydroquinate dehydratase I